ncbi:MAG: LPXTG cell wall anchor domain-containing protein [Microbacterium sp.]|nr:LPXTG cell wall anchor domain-containing protein [Microbacterium sp.]
MAMLIVPALAPMAAQAAPAADAEVTTIARAGAFTQVVPDGVCSVNVIVAGAPGGSAVAAGDVEPDPDGDPGDLRGPNGAGAVFSASLAVQAGQTLTGTVGGAGSNGGGGGLPGGGTGGTGTHRGAGGGGYSELSFGGDLLLLAAGGGGTGGGHTADFGSGGDGGFDLAGGVAVGGGFVYAGGNGENGQDSGVLEDVQTAPGGGLGGSTVGGAAGTNPRSQTDPDLPGFNWDGFAGSSLQGGNGGPDNFADAGGAGGGGFFGGGGGAATDGDVGGGATGYFVGGGGGGGASYSSESALLSGLDLAKNRDADSGAALAAFVEFDWVMCDYDLAVSKTVVGTPVYEDGATVRYSVVVTNNGPEDMAIGDTVTLVDDLATGGTLVSIDGLTTSEPAVGDTITGDIEAYDLVDLGGDIGERPRGLAAGASATFVYDVVVNGTEPVTNTVTISDRATEDADDVASATIDPAAPSLSLVKTASLAKATQVGQKITYSFAVTNTGNIDLRNIAIAEGSFSGKGTLPAPTCPADPVIPGASVTCTTVYTVVAEDLTGAAITNTASATASTPGGAAVKSADAAAQVPTVKPAVGLATTGGELNGLWVASGAAALLVGAAALFFARRRMS